MGMKLWQFGKLIRRTTALGTNRKLDFVTVVSAQLLNYPLRVFNNRIIYDDQCVSKRNCFTEECATNWNSIKPKTSRFINRRLRTTSGVRRNRSLEFMRARPYKISIDNGVINERY